MTSRLIQNKRTDLYSAVTLSFIDAYRKAGINVHPHSIKAFQTNFIKKKKSLCLL